nr:lysine-specific demethylase JMJ25-like [Tanacetum cinerariifolium]
MYWPSSKDVLAKDDLIRFRHHWTKGEPVIFRHVLEQTSGLSWEPMVMWRALCEHVDPTVSSKMSEVKTIECLRGCEKKRTGKEVSAIGMYEYKEVVMHTSANREESDDNYMYWPSSKDVLAKDDLIRFRHHWTKGEPVIFRHVLEQTSGLSWEPMVMWCALCEHVDPTVSSKMSEVKTI